MQNVAVNIIIDIKNTETCKLLFKKY